MVEVLPENIPNLVKIPIKDMVAPVHLLLTYFKKRDETVTSCSTDALFYYSPTDQYPHKTEHKHEHGEHEDEGKKDKNAPKKHVSHGKETLKQQVFLKHHPNEIIFGQA